MHKLVKAFLADERGETVIEYVMIGMMLGIVLLSLTTSIIAA